MTRPVDLRARDRVIGRIKHEGIVTVDVSLTWKEGPYGFTGTDHLPLFGYWAFSAMGAVWPRVNSRDVSMAGQILDVVRRVPAASRLVPLWERWHLNGAKVGCIHQGEPAYKQGRYGPEVDLSSVPPCPVTGYRYGSMWLVDEIPMDVLPIVRAEIYRTCDLDVFGEGR